MITYYDESGNILGQAWSHMNCRIKEKHTPHSHYPPHAIYGPYMCPGNPETPIYKTSPIDRKPVNGCWDHQP